MVFGRSRQVFADSRGKTLCLSRQEPQTVPDWNPDRVVSGLGQCVRVWVGNRGLGRSVVLARSKEVRDTGVYNLRPSLLSTLSRNTDDHP